MGVGTSVTKVTFGTLFDLYRMQKPFWEIWVKVCLSNIGNYGNIGNYDKEEFQAYKFKEKDHIIKYYALGTLVTRVTVGT